MEERIRKEIENEWKWSDIEKGYRVDRRGNGIKKEDKKERKCKYEKVLKWKFKEGDKNRKGGRKSKKDI